ncbi:unnamed protein product [Caenorhabditis nigoni]
MGTPLDLQIIVAKRKHCLSSKLSVVLTSSSSENLGDGDVDGEGEESEFGSFECSPIKISEGHSETGRRGRKTKAEMQELIPTKWVIIGEWAMP